MTLRLAAVATMALSLSAPAAARTWIALGALEFDFVITGFVHDGGTGLDAILDLPNQVAPPPEINRDNPGYWDKVVFNFRPPAGKAIAVNVEANRGAFRLVAPLSMELTVGAVGDDGAVAPPDPLSGKRSYTPISFTVEPLAGVPETFIIRDSFLANFQMSYPDNECDWNRLTNPYKAITFATVAGFAHDQILKNMRIEITPPPTKTGNPADYVLGDAGCTWDWKPGGTFLRTSSLDGSNGPMTLSLVDAPAPVPLPGAGPFALAGLVTLAALARRRRTPI